jgi:hypothetical protein
MQRALEVLSLYSDYFWSILLLLEEEQDSRKPDADEHKQDEQAVVIDVGRRMDEKS